MSKIEIIGQLKKPKFRNSSEMTAEQLNDPRIILENKPKVGINGEACVGWSPDEFRIALTSGVFAGFVLDFGHAACAALSVGKKTMELVTEFLAYEPEVFHLSDGDRYSEKDTHYNLGKGNLELKEYYTLIQMFMLGMVF